MIMKGKISIKIFRRKYFNNICFTKSAKNLLTDYFEVLNSEEIIGLLEDNIHNFNYDNEIYKLREVGLELDTNTRYVMVKCGECYNNVGIYNENLKEYIIINAI